MYLQLLNWWLPHTHTHVLGAGCNGIRNQSFNGGIRITTAVGFCVTRLDVVTTFNMLLRILHSNRQLSVAVQSGAWVLAVWILGSWVHIPFKACPVWAEALQQVDPPPY
jgi:hypothetical protein